MYEINKSIEQGFSGKPGGLYDILKQLQNGMAGIGGRVYYVEGNAGSDSDDLDAGQSWDRAYKTIAFAIGKSNTEIGASKYGYGRGWAARNTIFIKGSFTEDLVVMPQKADLVGVGSTNAEPRARIVGTQAPVATAWGTRIFNIWFNDDGASATFTTTAGGIQFHNCWFQGVGATVGTYGLYITNPEQVVVKDCIFSSYLENPFSTAAIALIADGQYNNVIIEGNDITGAVGIYCSDNALNNHFNCTIKNNIIKATTFCIDDNTDDYSVIGNLMISAAAEASAIDCNAAMAVGNILTSSDDTRTFPFATVS